MLGDLREIQALGVTHILDNRMEWSDEQFVARHAPGVTYLHNGQDDIGQRMARLVVRSWCRVRARSDARPSVRCPGALPHGHQPRAVYGLRDSARPRVGPLSTGWPSSRGTAGRRDRLRRRRAGLVAPTVRRRRRAGRCRASRCRRLVHGPSPRPVRIIREVRASETPVLNSGRSVPDVSARLPSDPRIGGP
jgi:hypothetical protein